MSLATLSNSPLLAAVYALLIFAVMLISAGLLLRHPRIASTATLSGQRYGTLDGLRGVLASGVFIHHSWIAFVYFRGARWEWTANPVLNQLGLTTVALFFLITGFLFSLKVTSGKVDWVGLYRSRLARLMPLYAQVVSIVFVSAFAVSGWQLREPVATLLLKYLAWLGLVVFDRPDVNGVYMTWQFIAGVNWSLKYEAIFYALGVPLLYLLGRILPNRGMLLLAGTAALVIVALIFIFDRGEAKLYYLIHFLCGVIAACIYRDPALRPLIEHPAFHWLAGCSVLILSGQLFAQSLSSLIVTLTVFLGAAGGMSCLGLLRTRAALWLGDISYGIYLLHGLVLWGILYQCRRNGLIWDIDLPGFVVLMGAVGGLVVLLASLSYVCIEKPVMRWAAKRATY